MSMKLLDIFNQILAEAWQYSLSNQFLLNFNQDFRKKIKSLVSTSSDPDKIQESIKYKMAKEFVIAGFKKVNLPEPRDLRVKMSPRDPDIFLVDSPDVKGKVNVVFDNEYKVLRDRTEIYRVENGKRQQTLIAPEGARRKIYTTKAIPKGPRKPREKKIKEPEISTKQQATPTTSTKVTKKKNIKNMTSGAWEKELFKQLKPRTGLAPNSQANINSILLKLFAKSVEIAVSYGLIKKEDINLSNLKYQNLNLKDEKGQLNYSVSKEPLEIETYINPYDYTIDKTKTTIRLYKQAIYPL